MSVSLEELFQTVKDMCLNKLAPELYTKLRAEMEAHIQSVCEELVVQQQGMPSEDFLHIMDQCWQNHCRNVVSGRSGFETRLRVCVSS